MLSWRERGKFEKVDEQVKSEFLKKNFIHDVRLIEKQVRLIEPDRGSQKFLNAILIDRKTDSIDRNCKKMNF